MIKVGSDDIVEFQNFDDIQLYDFPLFLSYICGPPLHFFYWIDPFDSFLLVGLYELIRLTFYYKT